jgi:hypothetical protein
MFQSSSDDHESAKPKLRRRDRDHDRDDRDNRGAPSFTRQVIRGIK